ncbi:MAG: hypothetical protein IT198_11555 [Acidimicrobiia bacterium]|nr:hypothetical protein [Acidimicrobiia bacterium]
MIETGTALPAIEMVDMRGRSANTAELATTGIPVILVASASSALCRQVEPALLEFAKLDEGDYNVWGLVEGEPEEVAAALPRLDAAIRLFAYLPGWEGVEALEVGAFPSVLAANRANEVIESCEGWDRAAWEGILNRLRGMLGWRPQSLSRRLPKEAAVLVSRQAAS